MFVYIIASKINKFRNFKYSTVFSTCGYSDGLREILYKKVTKRDKKRVNCQYFGQNRYKTGRNFTFSCKSAYLWRKI